MKNHSPYCTVDEARELVACCMAKNIPFYACRYPGETKCRFGAQAYSWPQHCLDNGFRIVPFDVADDAQPITIVPDIFPDDIDVLRSLPKVEVAPSFFVGDDVDRDTYLQQANTLIRLLNGGEMSKVVLSRTITGPYDVANHLPDCFVRMCQKYTNAYIFVVNYPGVCGWMGASPEVLLQSTPEGYATMALAGTRVAHTQEPWGEKERNEQQYVAGYICDVLDSLGLQDVRTTTYTKQAAQVEHLCTYFEIPAKYDLHLCNRLAESLHPTPAVAGTPTERAIQAIRATERRSRKYYAGYVGEVAANGECALFVNLRSMEFIPDAVRLYVGGGLTAQSIAVDEWNETCAKSQTLLSILQ